MFIQKLMWIWFRWIPHTFLAQHRFSAFWLRSKCSICSYQLNIWYGGHVPPSILNWFLQGDEVQELAPASSRVGLALQYRQDRPTSPLNTRRSSAHHCGWLSTLHFNQKQYISPPASTPTISSPKSVKYRINWIPKNPNKLAWNVKTSLTSPKTTVWEKFRKTFYLFFLKETKIQENTDRMPFLFWFLYLVYVFGGFASYREQRTTIYLTEVTQFWVYLQFYLKYVSMFLQCSTFSNLLQDRSHRCAIHLFLCDT